MGTLPALLTHSQVLLLGGGNIALQKAQALQKNSVDYSIIAADICSELRAGAAPCEQKDISAQDLKTADIIVDATGDPAVAELILAEQKQRYLLFNCVAQPTLGNIYFPAILNIGELKIAVSSDGSSPTVSRVVRDKIATYLPSRLAALLQQKKDERVRGIRDIATTERQCLELFSRVYLIGCGPGDVDLMTVKAVKTIEQMDVVLYDHLLTDDILALIPENTEKIFVGKEKGHHSVTQDRINEMLYEQAQRGLKIGRLKCGDSYIFGRGAEEAEYLIERGISVETISGISSALAGPACAGIPPTARGYATSMSIVTAHKAGCDFNEDWLPMLQIPHHTTIVLMGVTYAAKISAAALAAGVAADTPVAIVIKASRPDQEVRITNLTDLPQVAADKPRPAILVIGDVVNLHEKLTMIEQRELVIND